MSHYFMLWNGVGSVFLILIIIFLRYFSLPKNSDKKGQELDVGFSLGIILLIVLAFVFENVYISWLKDDTEKIITEETIKYRQGAPKRELISYADYELVKLIGPLSTKDKEIRLLLKYGSFIPKYFCFEEGKLRKSDGTVLDYKNFDIEHFQAQETEFLDPDPKKPGEFIKTGGWILHPIPHKKDS